MSTNVTRLDAERAAPTAVVLPKKTAETSDDWDSSEFMGTAGILAYLASQELEIENQIGAMQNTLAADAMKTQYKMVKSSATYQYESTQKDAQEAQYQAIQNGISAGVSGLQGGYMVGTSAMDGEINGAQKDLQSLKSTDEALQTHMDQIAPSGQRVGPGAAQGQAQANQADSAQALRDLRQADYRTSTGVSKLSYEDAEQARIELKEEVRSANSKLTAATQAMEARVQTAQAAGAFVTNGSQAVIQGAYISTNRSDKAVDQADGAYAQAASDIWKQAAQTNTQNGSQALQKGQDMQTQIWQAISSAVRA